LSSRARTSAILARSADMRTPKIAPTIPTALPTPPTTPYQPPRLGNQTASANVTAIASGVARKGRREDALHRGSQPLGERLGGESQRQAT
jgi:hypothetical protein